MLGWIGSKLFPITRYMIEINLAIAALFFIRNPIIAPFLVMAISVNISISFFAQNYTQRKDYLCCKCLEFFMVFKAIVAVGYILNCITYLVLTQENYVIFCVFCALHLCMGMSLFVCFFAFGYNIYRHSIAQILQVTIINLYFGLSLGNFHDLVLSIITA